MLHPAKRDRWIAVFLSVIAAAEAVAGAWLVALALVKEAYPVLVPGTVLVLTAALLTTILRGTNYEITDTSLVIRCGPFRRTVPLDAIEDVVPAEGMRKVTLIEWSFALSLRGLRLRYRKKNGGLTWPIRISPLDRSTFLLELAERVPELEPKEDGSLRRRVDSAVTE